MELDGGVHHFFYNMIFNLVRYEKSKVVPFVTGGVGLAAYALSDEARAKAADPAGFGIAILRPSEKRFAYNYGFGVKAKVTSRIGVRADFRHIFSDVPSYGLPKESSKPKQVVLPIQGKLQMYEASAGESVCFLSSWGRSVWSLLKNCMPKIALFIFLMW